MDFETLMNIASAKQKNKDKIKINRYSHELPPPKKEVKEVAHSDTVKKLIQEKKNEKKMKDKIRKEKEKAKELEEKKKSQFRIPKKKPETKIPSDTEKFINSLFEDEDDENSPEANGLDVSNRLSPVDSVDSPKSSSHSTSKSNHKHSSNSIQHKSSSHSGEKEKPSSHSSSSHRSSKSTSNSLSEDKKHHGSSSHSKSSSSSSALKSSSSHSKSSSSQHGTKSSSHSSTSKHKSSSHSHSSKSPSSAKSSSLSSSSSKSSSLSSSSSKSSSTSSSSSKSSSTSSSSLKSSSNSVNSKSPPSSSFTDQPITLSKHHLKPVAERHADSVQLSEKEKILAKLQAIKQRTLDTIKKEQQGKSKRSRVEKSSSRNSKGGEKEDERVKSKEIVKDVYSSDEEVEDKDSVPSVIDIMLNEHQSKLERDKITRMAKQAWERATRKDNGDVSTSERKKEKRFSKKSSTRSSLSNHLKRRREHSLSPDPRSADKKKVKASDEQRKKPKIVRHAGNAAPPPPDFKAILAMAEQKVKDPSKGLPSIPKKKKKKPEEEEVRPMTQEEKERKHRVNSKEYQHWLKYGGSHPGKGKENSSSTDEDDQHMKNNNVIKRKEREMVVGGAKRDPKMLIKPGLVGSAMKSKGITVNENVLVCGPADDDASDDDRRGHSRRPESTNPFDRIYNSVHKKSDQRASKKRRLEEEEVEEEEEEDSDMDGFIDDGEDEGRNISSHIAKIFGYNKNGYVDEDDDLSDMEANYATVMAEEKRSAKLGLMEDLEDMKREEEELKMKAMLKKKMRR